MPIMLFIGIRDISHEACIIQYKLRQPCEIKLLAQPHKRQHRSTVNQHSGMKNRHLSLLVATQLGRINLYNLICFIRLHNKTLRT